METAGGDKPRPNLLPSDFSALREGYSTRCIQRRNYMCDKELLSQGDSSKTGDKDDQLSRETLEPFISLLRMLKILGRFLSRGGAKSVSQLRKQQPNALSTSEDFVTHTPCSYRATSIMIS